MSPEPPLGRPTCRDDFEIGIICALPTEFDAVAYTFDLFWDEDGDPYGRAKGDNNTYTTGRIGKHHVVLALLSGMGTVSAASLAANMKSSYCRLRLALLVGVCGGMPFLPDEREVLLGDVVISKTIVQYDFGRQYPDKFMPKSTIDESFGRANKDIRNLTAKFETKLHRHRLKRGIASFLKQLQDKAAEESGDTSYRYPGAAQDKLFKPSYRHKHHGSETCVCSKCFQDTDPVCSEAASLSCERLRCDSKELVTRQRLGRREADSVDLELHVGRIASGNTVVKSAAFRDALQREAKVIAIEMEGAGVWDEIPCIIVKGVCDYADCHKTKAWQNYAAATAASAAKAILKAYTPNDKGPGTCNDGSSGNAGEDRGTETRQGGAVFSNIVNSSINALSIGHIDNWHN
ncbi:nucleoside phosphorylase domain-containing protein [Thelonectria olida]|uniref:Nucleoside phosphorylase domain-containing protein n=1 Tax=Thelonectria olida TaxID=1576542 RepID=A0A9P9AHP2_9HYPO|nr:nucleoside phosphorylase domain-containing protein [Thelonectria olida]